MSSIPDSIETDCQYYSCGKVMPHRQFDCIGIIIFIHYESNISLVRYYLKGETDFFVYEISTSYRIGTVGTEFQEQKKMTGIRNLVPRLVVANVRDEHAPC